MAPSENKLIQGNRGTRMTDYYIEEKLDKFVISTAKKMLLMFSKSLHQVMEHFALAKNKTETLKVKIWCMFVRES